jgi:lipopolysaccharide transport system ATP-binding protein
VSDAAISVRHLGKAYRLYSHPRDMLFEALSGKTRHQEFQALDDVSFEVGHGRVVGLMGRNGAGKSTLLRIIAGTLDASSGEVRTAGRIAAILELGTGFHPDYTGRENIYLGGLCLGLSRKEVQSRVDEVIAFSELQDHIDRPFRTYSSGMQARLTFSVATCIDPDILIIDEALSVGDARFQLKSFDRIREFKRRGKSILLVSHSINHITSLCDHAILLDGGKLLMQGEPNAVGNTYHELLFGVPTAKASLPSPVKETRETAATAEIALPAPLPAAETVNDREHRYGDGVARIVGFRLTDPAGHTVTRLQSCNHYIAEIVIRAMRQTEEMCVGILVRNRRGQDIFGSDMAAAGAPLLAPLGPHAEVTVRVGLRANLAAGEFFFTVALARGDGTKHDIRFDALMVQVEPVRALYTDTVVNLEPCFEVMAHLPDRLALMAER